MGFFRITLSALVISLFIGGVIIGSKCFSPASNLYLSDLYALKIDGHTTAANDLLDPSYWSLVRASFSSTLVQLVPETIVGYINDSQEMKQWAIQNIDGPPRWLTIGLAPSLLTQFDVLRTKALSSQNSIQAVSYVKDFATSIAGFSLSGLDFLSFNGLTALRIFAQTGNVQQAICATFPSLIGALYSASFDSSLSRNDRAKIFGQAIALTSVIGVLGGIGGFSSKFEAALNRVGLLDAWPKIKPYLSKIGGTVSAKAASTVFSILQTLAKRFPSDSGWTAGLTTDRIESMAGVLKQKGFSDTAIEQKIAGLAQAAANSDDPEGVASAADGVSYSDGGGMRVKIESNRHITLYSDAGKTADIKPSFLEKEVPGFVYGKAVSLKISYWENGLTVYHYYKGGDTWAPSYPTSLTPPNTVLTVTIQVLTREDFLKSLPRFTLTNDAGLRWMPSNVQITDVALNGKSLKVGFSQSPPVEGLPSFSLEGVSSDSLGWVPDGTFLQFQVTDMFGGTRTLRIYHDGYSDMWMSMKGKGAMGFERMYLESFDGVKLRLITHAGTEYSAATLYMKDPSVLYSLSDIVDGSLDYKIDHVSHVYQIDNVVMQRQLEKAMLAEEAATYAHGRLGAEIAYTVAMERLGLKDVVLVEPSIGGKDLYTADGTVVIQARLLTAPKPLQLDLKGTLGAQLKDLVEKLREDFQYNDHATTGYAVLSYLDPGSNMVKTIILEVPKY